MLVDFKASHMHYERLKQLACEPGQNPEADDSCHLFLLRSSEVIERHPLLSSLSSPSSLETC